MKGEIVKPIPASYTVKHRIGLYLHKHPDTTVEQLMAVIKGPRGNYVRQQTEELARDEFIFAGANGGFHLSTRYQKHFDQIEVAPKQKADLVQPREAPTFRPIQAKYIPSLQPRREPLREWDYQNGSTDFTTLVGYRLQG